MSATESQPMSADAAPGPTGEAVVATFRRMFHKVRLPCAVVDMQREGRLTLACVCWLAGHVQ